MSTSGRGKVEQLVYISCKKNGHIYTLGWYTVGDMSSVLCSVILYIMLYKYIMGLTPAVFKDILQIIPARPNLIKLGPNTEKHDDKRAVCLLWGI